MRETKARFLLNALSLGACLGVLTGVLEALYLIGTKQSLFATGVRDVGLLFDGVVINGAAGLVLGAGSVAVLALLLPVLAKSVRYALLISMLVSITLSVIVSTKSGAIVPLMDGPSIWTLALTGLLSFAGAQRLLRSRGSQCIDNVDLVIHRLRLVAIGTVMLTLGVQAVEAAVQTWRPISGSMAYPNIMIIMIDSARADRFSSYGYERNTTPHIDTLAKTGTRFENAYANSNWTPPSTATLFSGKYLSQIGFGKEYAYLDDEHLTIAELLTQHGYQTIAFSNSPHITERTNLHRGFENFLYMWERFEGIQYFSFYRVGSLLGTLWDRLQEGKDKGTRKTIAMVRKWLRSHDERQAFFMFVHIIDPHAKYLPPSRLLKNPGIGLFS